MCVTTFTASIFDLQRNILYWNFVCSEEHIPGPTPFLIQGVGPLIDKKIKKDLKIR